ncbi:hypothetical protein C5Y97_25875 [Blastopirellula marina]|uniref:Uncharacterized protein n=2 Tax=Blastopirellula marina TaxID=124 RepID=A0A2S8F8S1_9BACT|nr:hypothetical protein C5Y98_25860 [Blastopirellula marina]PTL41864.1 hypothetical protein C5Y97_25875 [Blastopirellula marina]
MELTAACAVSASLAWWIGPVASFVLMLASCGIVLRQGWAVLVAMTLLCAIAGANYAGRIHRGDFLGVGLSMVFIGLFAWYRVALRKRLLRKSRDT